MYQGYSGSLRVSQIFNFYEIINGYHAKLVMILSNCPETKTSEKARSRSCAVLKWR